MSTDHEPTASTNRAALVLFGAGTLVLVGLMGWLGIDIFRRGPEPTWLPYCSLGTSERARIWQSPASQMMALMLWLVFGAMQAFSGRTATTFVMGSAAAAWLLGPQLLLMLAGCL